MIFEYYLIFSATTAFCMFWLNRQARIESGVKTSTFIFYLLSFILGFIFAPIFFLIFVFHSESYKAGIVQAIKETYS
jgi:hypothetical protein